MKAIIPLLIAQIAIVAAYFALRRRPPRSKLGSVAHQLSGPYRRRR